jgi:hypothetical protein
LAGRLPLGAACVIKVLQALEEVAFGRHQAEMLS